MCLIIALLRPEHDYPLIIGANRDEAYSRPGEPPRLLSDSPRIWGGRDSVAGGTWLGISETGLVVAVTNGPKSGHRPDRRSRGLLCLDALKQPNPGVLKDWLSDEVRRNEYNGFNLLWSDGRNAQVAYWHTALQIEALQPSLHLLANRPQINDSSDLKLNRCFQLLDGIGDLDEPAAVSRMGEVCCDHGKTGENASCIHGDDGGTLSSTILSLHRSGISNSRYLHTEGHPCERDYDDFTKELFRPDAR